MSPDLIRCHIISYHIKSYLIGHDTWSGCRKVKLVWCQLDPSPSPPCCDCQNTSFPFSSFEFLVMVDEHLVVMLVAAAELFCSFSTRGCHFPSHLNR